MAKAWPLPTHQDHQNMFHEEWFEANFDKESLDSNKQNKTADFLTQVLRFIKSKSLKSFEHIHEIIIKSDYPLNWGLGSSSTLFYCLGQAFEVDPFELQEEFLGGSGYDIACASSKSAITFIRDNSLVRSIHECCFAPENPDQWAFIYLGQKQDTREAIQHFRQSAHTLAPQIIDKISQITQALSEDKACKAEKAIELFKEHEFIMSGLLKLPSVQTEKFSAFDGVVKSLGAWGGDFVLAVTQKDQLDYSFFYDRGFPNVLPYYSLVFR